jgi:putative oxidoreductase
MDAGLLVLRVVLGAIMAAHGAQKLVGWFGGPGLDGTSAGLESMGLKPPRVHAAVGGASEFGGGLLLAFGLLTPLGAAAVAGVMIVAIATVHLKNGFFNALGGYEFNLLIIATAIALAITGPGEISIDSVTGWSLSGPEWGLGALGLAVFAAGSVLATRRPQPAPAREVEPPEEQVA